MAPSVDSPPPAATTQEPEFTITQISSAADFERFLSSLRRLLQACVNPDPPANSLGFVAPLSDSDACTYWLSLWPQIAPPSPLISLFVLTRSSNALPIVLGTVQLVCNSKPTHLHKAEVSKLLVHPDMRGKGLGSMLLKHVEEFAVREKGKRMLILDTATETPAKKFYDRSGWIEYGFFPGSVIYADGQRTDCTFFYKLLE